MPNSSTPERSLSFADSRAVLRHLLATLAYRASKVLRDVPASFANRSFGSPTRKPVLIVAHLADLMAWGRSLARGEYEWKAGGDEDWEAEVRRFYAELAAQAFTPPSLAGSTLYLRDLKSVLAIDLSKSD